MGFPRVSTYMSHAPHVISPTEPLYYAKNVLLRRDVEALVVVDDARVPVGILTLGDIIRALSGDLSFRPLSEIPVEEAMTPSPIVVESTRSVKTAVRLMVKYGVKGLPVVDGSGRLTGFFSKRDVMRVFADKTGREYLVGGLARPHYTAVRSTHSIYHVARMIEVDPAGKTVVIDDSGRLVGVITRSDLYTRGLGTPSEVGRLGMARAKAIFTAEDVMTRDPILAHPWEDASEAARIMVKEGIGMLPVVDKNRGLRGVLTVNELILGLLKWEG